MTNQQDFLDYQERIQLGNECNYSALMALRNKIAKISTKKKGKSVF